MRNKLAINTIASLFNQITTIVCGFILPRYMLAIYGSSVNGLVSSITQFLSVIAFMQLGVGAVVQSTLYKPLATHDKNEISKIFVSAQRFFRTIAVIFAGYTLCLTIIYPLLAGKDFNYWFSASLIIIISINSFSQYYFGITNQMLLWADQKAYISLFVDSATLIANTVISIIVMYYGGSIQFVKFVATTIFIFRPICLLIYVKRHYQINQKIEFSEEPIKQKWNGFAQHLASAVMDNTDVIILTVFSNLENVSIYYVYHLVVNGIRQLVTSITVGVQAFFGKIYATCNREVVVMRFNQTEIVFHYIVTVMFLCVGVLIVPFVKVYTRGVEDVNYTVPCFAFLITIAQGVYCYRLVYFMMVKAAGHYKQTQNSAIIEMTINLIVSIVLVIKFGLIGVAIGTLVATIYRTIYFVHYLSRQIINLSIKKTVGIFFVDFIAVCLSIFICRLFKMDEVSYYSWALLALKTTLTVFIICTFAFLSYQILFDKNGFNELLKLIKSKYGRSK